MRQAVIALTLVGLASCSGANDSKVCTPIVDPPPPSDPVAMVKERDTLEWSVGNAERCLHRHGYRLAGGEDDADIVARAVVQACEKSVERAVSYRRAEAFQGEPDGTPLDIRIKSGDEAEAAARRSWSEFALMKVVEGRAGNCEV